MSTAEKQLVENLRQSPIYREFESAFRGATGLPLAFAPVETWGLSLQDDPNENPFCHLLAQTNASCAACLRLQEELRQRATEGLATATCFSGLSDSAVPVKLGDRVIGFLHTGQVFTREPTPADFDRTLATLERWGLAGDIAGLRAAYFACPVVPPVRYAAILRLLKLFAEQLALAGNQFLVTAEAGNPQITQAREFIAEHLDEDIGLADGARAAHMSAFYFCKIFKRATGLTFTDYVSRLRTEKAKTLLLAPHVRVSEAAFEVGFQSLSQFNRVFKKITGQSPSDYRHGIATATVARTERSPGHIWNSRRAGARGRNPEIASRAGVATGARFAVAAT